MTKLSREPGDDRGGRRRGLEQHRAVRLLRRIRLERFMCSWL